MTPHTAMDRVRATFEQGVSGCPIHEDPRRCWAGQGRHGRPRHFDRASRWARVRAHAGVLNTYVRYIHPVRSRRCKEIRGQGHAEGPCPTLPIWLVFADVTRIPTHGADRVTIKRGDKL